MRSWRPLMLCGLTLAMFKAASAEAQGVHLPSTIQAGQAFSIESAGSGPATVYIVGPSQVWKHSLRGGETLSVPAGTLYNAGHYLVITQGSTTEQQELDVLPADRAANISFLARPSRLPVGMHNGISGAAYVFDAYQNLVLNPTTVTFRLSSHAASGEQRAVTTRNGVAWTQLDSSTKEGIDSFVAEAPGASSTHVIEQVPGDPCSLRISAHQAGQRLQLETEPVRDCSGNSVPDGTIVTFTENHAGSESTVDVPLKRGVAKVELPAYPGATISVASGVVMGNEIRVGGR
jgi:hypothetical protein